MASVSEPSVAESSRNVRHVHLKRINRETNDIIHIWQLEHWMPVNIDGSQVRINTTERGLIDSIEPFTKVK